MTSATPVALERFENALYDISIRVLNTRVNAFRNLGDALRTYLFLELMIEICEILYEYLKVSTVENCEAYFEEAIDELMEAIPYWNLRESDLCKFQLFSNVKYLSEMANHKMPSSKNVVPDINVAKVLITLIENYRMGLRELYPECDVDVSAIRLLQRSMEYYSRQFASYIQSSIVMIFTNISGVSNIQILREILESCDFTTQSIKDLYNDAPKSMVRVKEKKEDKMDEEDEEDEVSSSPPCPPSASAPASENIVPQFLQKDLKNREEALERYNKLVQDGEIKENPKAIKNLVAKIQRAKKAIEEAKAKKS